MPYWRFFLKLDKPHSIMSSMVDVGKENTKKKGLWERKGKIKMARRCIYLTHHEHEISSYVNSL